jgi:hypothetical protein
MIILKYVREIRWEDINWIYLAQDRVQWRGVVSAVMFGTS